MSLTLFFSVCGRLNWLLLSPPPRRLAFAFWMWSIVFRRLATFVATYILSQRRQNVISPWTENEKASWLRTLWSALLQGAHLPIRWLFAPAKRSEGRANYCLGWSFLRYANTKYSFCSWVDWTRTLVENEGEQLWDLGLMSIPIELDPLVSFENFLHEIFLSRFEYSPLFLHGKCLCRKFSKLSYVRVKNSITFCY